jgi:uncharacterized repeat protein (TIGR03803 family)
LLLTFAATATVASAQTFQALATFDGTNGIAPVSVVQGFDGNFYGTTTGGGAGGSGTVFKITPSGTLTTLHSFCTQANCSDGSFPESGLVQAADGNLYGTTSDGALNNGGTFFRITPAGTLTTLYRFCAQLYCPDGLHPYAQLIQGADGNFYGTTEFGGTYDYGAIFKISPGGGLTLLYSFCALANCLDGSIPDGQLVQAPDGTFYGTTISGGGPAYAGTVFRMTPEGKLTTLYSFCQQSNCADGNSPMGGLVQASDGTLYGTTSTGGTLYLGTVFKIDTKGKLTTLHNFCSLEDCADGVYPYSGLLPATDGNFYGTTAFGGIFGGSDGGGSIYRITPLGELSTVYSFCAEAKCRDGTDPFGLIQATDGSFYGTAVYGGEAKDGTVFSLTVGLQPFVTVVPASGKVGSKVTILGTNLSGTSVVAFSGAMASFVVDSSSAITATVPTAATTGSVTVTTPGGPLTSNVAFRIIH